MSARLESATRELLLACPGLSEIVRVDVDDEGGLVLTAAVDPGTRWFTYDGRGLIERFPERDPKLPLAARLEPVRDWRVLSYRPDRRMVVAVQHGERVNVLKGHRRGRSGRAAAHQDIAEQVAGRGGFRVPHLLRRDDVHEALVFEYLEAREAELDLATIPRYARLGAQLAIFQEDRCAADLKAFLARDEFDVLERWQRKVVVATGTLPAGWQSACARLRRCAEELPEPRFGLCHRDLHDRQIHLIGDEVAVLDFDLLCRADVALDPGNLSAHLRWRAVQGLHGADENSVHALERAFLGALAREHEPGFGARLAFYRASALLRLALVYRLRPRWSGRVHELVSRAEASLDDLCRTN